MEIPANTILYNNVDLYSLAYLRVFAYSTFTAPLRQRRVVIPGRSGSYDYDQKANQRQSHDDRTIRAECLIERKIAPTQFDDLKYTLSRRGRIIMWDQTDRYYYGQAVNAAEVLDYGKLTAATFTLEFLCDPYAYAITPTTLVSNKAIIPVSYKGTRETPTYITIRNTGSTPMQAVQIIRREVTRGG